MTILNVWCGQNAHLIREFAMLQQLLPLPGFVPIGPANDLAPDPFEGMMPRFLELPLRMYFAESKTPRPKPVETPALEVVAAPEPPPEPPPPARRAISPQRKLELIKIKNRRQQRIKNTRRSKRH